MLNFLPQNYRRKVIIGYIFRTYVFLFTFIFVALFILILLFIPSAIFSKYKNRTVTNQLQSTKAVNANEGIDAVALIKKLNGIVKALSSDNSKNILPSDLINKILSIKNKDIKISAISISNNDDTHEKIVISGIADTRDSLTLFDKNLIDDGTFESVDLPISELIKNVNADFTITLTYKKK